MKVKAMLEILRDNFQKDCVWTNTIIIGNVSFLN